MRKAPFFAKELSAQAQTFLYACAFWAVAADEELKSSEQMWLMEQFGKDGATNSLEEFVALESNDFFKAFDDAAAAYQMTRREEYSRASKNGFFHVLNQTEARQQRN